MNKINNIQEKHYKYLWAIVFLIAAGLSYTLIHDLYLNWGFIKNSILYLDNKANTAMALTGASTSASVAISLIPGDAGMPIAEKLADISSYSILVLAAIHLEKYLITIAAVLACRILVPAAMILSAFNVVLFNNKGVKVLARRACAFSVAIILVVPASVYLSTLIEKTYEADVQLSIEQTQKEAEEIKEQLEEDSSIWDTVVTSISGGSVKIMDRFETALNNFIEVISVMLITACAIPLFTFMVLMWFIKSILQINFQTPKISSAARRVRFDPNAVRGEAYDEE